MSPGHNGNPPLGIGQRIRDLRERKRIGDKMKMSLADLAAGIGCSSAAVYKMEVGKTRISATRLQQLCDVLLAPDDASGRAELYKLAGYAQPDLRVAEAIEQIVNEALRLPECADFAHELIVEMRACVEKWKRVRQTNRIEIHKVVIAAAGWQADAFTSDRFQRTLLPAVDEARQVSDDVEVFVVTRQRDLRQLKETFVSCAIRPLLQPEPLGLGNALLAAKAEIGTDPFALLLPDDIDPSGRALADLIRLYEKVRKPLVAIEKHKPQNDMARYSGFVKVGDKKGVGLFEAIRLEEKPGKTSSRFSEQYRRIIGRYVLTSEIMHELEIIQIKKEGSAKHDLTTAINELLKVPGAVLSYELPQRMLSIAPYREVIDLMDKRKKSLFDENTYQSDRLQGVKR